MTTFFQTNEDAPKGAKWWVVDASGIPVGRLASEIAHLIRGKHRPNYTPHVDGGDFVIVINSEKIALTGNKMEDKLYRHHTGFIGHLKEIPARKMIEKSPEVVIQRAVKGMLPEGILGHRMLKKLKVFRGAEHTHGAQMPETYTLKFYTKAA